MNYLKWLRAHPEHRLYNRKTLLLVPLLLLLAVGLSVGLWSDKSEVQEVVIESDTSTTSAVTQDDEAESTENDRDTKQPTYDLTNLQEFTDAEVGIQFFYPVEWGVVRSVDDLGDCPPGVAAGHCVLRTYQIQNPASGQSSVIGAAVTDAYALYPPARGSRWYDQVWQTDGAAVVDCEQGPCQTIITGNEVRFARYQSGRLFEGVDSSGAASLDIPRYITTLPEGVYTQVIISAQELDWIAEDSQTHFKDTVLDTFAIFSTR